MNCKHCGGFETPELPCCVKAAAESIAEWEGIARYMARALGAKSAADESRMIAQASYVWDDELALDTARNQDQLAQPGEMVGDGKA